MVEQKPNDSDALTVTVTLATAHVHHVFPFHPSHIPPAGISSHFFLMALNHFLFDHYYGQIRKVLEKMLKAEILREPMDPFR